MISFDRRQFCKLIASAPQIMALVEKPGRAESGTGGFPPGDYTPFGYLDNPWHAWDLNPSGVLRSLPGIGIGWYYPAGPGGYFDYQRNNVYALELSLAFQIGSPRFRLPEDFAPAQLSSPHHTKNILAYAFVSEDIRVTTSFALLNENAVGATVELWNRSSERKAARILAIETYRLGGAKWWGRDGLAGKFDAAAGALSIRSFAAGTASALAGSLSPSAHFICANGQEIGSWFEGASTSHATSYYPGPLYGGLRYEVELGAGSRKLLTLVMTRGANEHAAEQTAKTSIAEAPVVLTGKRAEDNEFWREAPQLEGDWPIQWKHGWVYDFETLRMMFRQPAGVYKHPWDAMQIQAPRNVLAETSIDMWALSYASPAAAKAVFLGQFQDALEDNIPCMREDGVMNMVAADGSACGTSISWCYPFFCAASIFERAQDLAWLRELYPHLARLLRWTLNNRKDPAGFLVGKCSWETGMDASKRFLINQPTGGELTEFVRLPELQAAAAQAARVLARFAERVGDQTSFEEWKRLEAEFAARTQQFWKNGWFRDFDARSGELVTTTEPDLGQAGPIFCGLANEEQKRAALQMLRTIYERSREKRTGWDDGLAWSSLVLPYVEAVWAAGDRALAGEVIASIADRIYLSMDRREITNSSSDAPGTKLGWPGVSCEIWGAHGAMGGEGYGWGAVMPAHIMRTILGLRETPDHNRMMVCPNLPNALAVPGKRYALSGWHFGPNRLNLQYEVARSGEIGVSGKSTSGTPPRSIVDEKQNAVEVRSSGAEWQFTAANHGFYTVAF